MSKIPHMTPEANPRTEPAPSSVVDTAEETPVEEELLVEEISIDGMCGVY